ncbi:hypothetical protein [Coleofasciculus sp. FACHB-1120]|nr:hypothetical protein [Coleofasciculus sp. FACHB-1120]
MSELINLWRTARDEAQTLFDESLANDVMNRILLGNDLIGQKPND